MTTTLFILDDKAVYLDMDSDNNDGYGLSQTTSEWQAKANSDTGKIVCHGARIPGSPAHCVK